MWLVSCFDVVEATFSKMLFRELYRQKEQVDFSKLIQHLSNEPGDSQDWKAKMAGIESLVQQTVDLFKKLSPADANQSLLEDLERMKKENAELQAPQSQSRESMSATPPGAFSSKIPDMFKTTKTADDIGETTPMSQYRIGKHVTILANHTPKSHTMTELDRIKVNVPPRRVPRVWRWQKDDLGPILSDWGLPNSILAKSKLFWFGVVGCCAVSSWLTFCVANLWGKPSNYLGLDTKSTYSIQLSFRDSTKFVSHFQKLWFASIQFLIATFEFTPALPYHGKYKNEFFGYWACGSSLRIFYILLRWRSDEFWRCWDNVNFPNGCHGAGGIHRALFNWDCILQIRCSILGPLNRQCFFEIKVG